MEEMQCPNCGHGLKGHKTERQSAGDRDVILQWVMCENCSHVALRNWTFSARERVCESAAPKAPLGLFRNYLAHKAR